MTMGSKNKWSKREAIEKLLSFYATIEFKGGEEDLLKKPWRRVIRNEVDVSAYYEGHELNVALNVLMCNPDVADNYARNAVESYFAEEMILLKYRKEHAVETAIEELVEKFVSILPVEMNVYMKVYGAEVKEIEHVGAFTFVPANKFEALGISGIPEAYIQNIKDKIWENSPHVSVAVKACDANKAKVKAWEEFQWLENAIRLFLGSSFYDFGITSFNFSRVENAIVVQNGGHLKGTSSHLKGAPMPFDLRKMFESNSPIRKMVEILGKDEMLLNPIQRRLRHLVYLGGMAAHETTLAMAYFLGVSALETFFKNDTDRYVSASLAQQIVESVCFLVADEDKRRAVFEEMRPFYKNRSAFAHGGQKDIEQNDVRRVLEYLRIVVLKFLTDPILSKLQSAEEMAELVRTRKFGAKS